MIKLTLIFSIIFLIVTWSCTSNPIFDDEQKAYDRHNISGTVRLNDSALPQDVYVWMEELNIYTFSDATGRFTLKLPDEPGNQGLNGVYSLYFYLGNYQFVSGSALVRDGLFEYGEKNISSEGTVKDVAPLERLLDITTIISPEELNLFEADTLQVQLLIENTDSAVSVRTYKDRENQLAVLFVKEAGAPNHTAQHIFFDSYRPVTETISSANSVSTVIPWNGQQLQPGSITLTAGEYEIFSFVFVHQEALPVELINSFGSNADKFSDAYLNVPFKQTAARLIIN